MSVRTPAMGIPALSPRRTRLGHYELFERFAVGNMAELFLGQARGEEGFEKLVVIKRLLPRLAEDARFVQMLQIEARIHASLSHKNIVQIHDLGMSSDGEYFIVLEYVDGRDLGALLDRHARAARPGASKRIDDAVGLSIMAEVAEGVHFAHEMRALDGNPLGLVHRDISPSNILLSYAGEVKLSDFGVAKRNSDSSIVTSLKGELGYISPEQARGAVIDRRSDIFSLGAVAFEIFTGAPLRVLAGTPDDYLKAASGIVTAPTRYRPDIPAAIERLLASALAPDPRDRFPDARQFLDACRAALATVPRPEGGETAELKALLASLLPPGTRSHGKAPSKVISLVPNLWEDVTVPDSPMPALTADAPSAPVRAAAPPPLRVAPQPASPWPALSVPEPQAGPARPPEAVTRLPAPARNTMKIARPASLPQGQARTARKRRSLAWAGLSMLALASSALLSFHVYVMPLPVALAYLRPAFLVVSSEPTGADIYVDGKKVVGSTPAEVEVKRDHAQHLVEVRKDGFVPAHQNLRYDRDVRLEVSLQLSAEPRPLPPR